MDQITISLGIKKIKEQEFFVDEALDFDLAKGVNINFEVTTNIKKEDTTVEILITTTFSDKNESKPFLRIKVSNVFLLPEVLSLPQPEKDAFKLPNDLLVTLLSLSISHSRALLAKNVLGTRFQEVYIPIVNPTEVAGKLFGFGNSK